MDTQVSQEERLEIFEFLVGRENKYYQIQQNRNWKETIKSKEKGFFEGAVLSEADIYLSIIRNIGCEWFSSGK